MGDYQAKKAALPHHREQLQGVRSQAIRTIRAENPRDSINVAAAAMEHGMARAVLRGAMLNPNVNSTQFRSIGQDLVRETKSTWGL